jgi:predicted ribonuclease YlaK
VTLDTPAAVTPQSVMVELDAMKREMNTLALGMAQVSRELEPVEAEYRRFVDDFEIGLWQAHVNDGAKLPPKELRMQLAHRAMDPALYGRYFALTNSRDRMVRRISALKLEVEASRSMLSAMKEGLV